MDKLAYEFAETTPKQEVSVDRNQCPNCGGYKTFVKRQSMGCFWDIAVPLLLLGYIAGLAIGIFGFGTLIVLQILKHLFKIAVSTGLSITLPIFAILIGAVLFIFCHLILAT